jgi:SAM-dependent methyltransferase
VRNIAGERPTRDLHGRLAFTRRFIPSEEIRERDVVDVGCGYGSLVLAALDAGAHSVTGVDVSEAALATAKTHIHDPRVRFLVGDASRLPLADSSVDAALCFEVIEHVPRGTERTMIAEIRRVLRPGGRLFLSTPNRSLAATALDPAWWLLGHRHYDPDEVCRLIEGGGFRVLSVEVRGGWFEIFSMLDLYASKWLLRRGPIGEERLRNRVDREWGRPGFTNIFLRAASA